MKKIEIKGPIIGDGQQKIYDFFCIPATSPGKVNAILSVAAEDEAIELIINSPGGLVPSGSEIYTALKSHAGRVTAKVVGFAASAASFIAMAADELWMSPTAQMMIHRGSTVAEGNRNDFEHIADVLSGVDEAIAKAYQMKTGIGTADLLDMMSKETWLNAMKAKELRFADGILFQDENEVVNSLADVSSMLPQAVIEKMQMYLPTEASVNSKKERALACARARAALTLSKL